MAQQGAFQTPQNERSFSALVDQVVLESGKTNKLRSVVQYANLSITECQGLGLSARDAQEDVITESADASPFIWEKPMYHRSIRTVRYRTQDLYPTLKLPGRQQQNIDQYYYAVDDSYVFKGPLLGEEIDVFSYYWKKPMIYYARLGTVTTAYPFGPYAVRPAFYDIELDKWQYLNLAGTAYVDTISDDDAEALRRKNAYIWIFEKWYDMIVDGAKAKLYKDSNDDRAVAAYASYKAAQMVFRNTSFLEAEGFAGVGGE